MEGLSLAPSSAHIWGAPDGCTGYPRMVSFAPKDDDTDAKREGIAAHELAAEMVRAGLAYATHRADVVGQSASNGVVYTDEMFEAAEMYVDDVKRVMELTGVTGGTNLGIEARVVCTAISSVTIGYVDCWIYDHNNDTLYIWDFKFGHRPVEVFENWQLIAYYSGIHANDVDDQFRSVDFRIVQPRSFHEDGTIRSWKAKGGELRAHVNILKTQADVALSDNATAQTGNHCGDCRARHACIAAQKAAMTGIEYSARPEPVDMDPQQLGLELRAIQRAAKAMEDRRTGLEARVEALIRDHVKVPGYRMASKKGNRAWNAPGEDNVGAFMIALGDTMGYDLQSKKVVTPAEAERLGMDKATVGAFTHKPSGAPKLTADDGSRVRQIFSNTE